MKQDSPLWHAKHAVRALLILIVGIIAMVLLRSFLVPDSWGDSGWYRGDNVTEQRAKLPRHGGDEACLECHEQEFTTHASAAHAVVRCEGCHAPVADHVANGEKYADMPMHHNTDLCLNCHRQLAARPSKFPQIQPREHVRTQGGEYGPEACFDCHYAHEPL